MEMVLISLLLRKIHLVLGMERLPTLVKQQDQLKPESEGTGIDNSDAGIEIENNIEEDLISSG